MSSSSNSFKNLFYCLSFILTNNAILFFLIKNIAERHLGSNHLPLIEFILKREIYSFCSPFRLLFIHNRNEINSYFLFRIISRIKLNTASFQINYSHLLKSNISAEPIPLIKHKLIK